MTFSSRSLNQSQTDPPLCISTALSLRKALVATFWSPLLLLTGTVHVLCQQRTKKFFTAVMILDIPLQWGTHIDFDSSAASMGALGGFDFSITTISLLALYIGWLFTGRTESVRPRSVWSWPIATYTTVLIVSLFVASEPLLSLFQICLVIQTFLFYIYLAGNIHSRSDILSLLYLLLLGGMLESAYILVLAGAGHDFAIVRTIGLKAVLFPPTGTAWFPRPGGTIGAPNFAAAYLAIIITLAICIRRMDVPAYLRRLAIPTIALAGLALVATLSRGGWVELLLSVAILTGATWLRNGISVKNALVAAVITGVVGICLYVPNPVSSRIFADDNGAAHSRLPLMHLAYRIISANPVLGVGANNFAVVMNDYASSEFRHEWIYTVHNEFLLVLSETGVLGLLAFLWIYLDIIRRAWRLWKSRDGVFSPLGLGIVAAIGGYLSHMFVDIFSERGLLQLIWMFVAVVAACEIIWQRERAEQLSRSTTEVTVR